MRERILEEALDLVQARGFDGFSFADVAERVGIRKASIHHHFPTKADLGVRLVERFRADCAARLGAIDARTGPIGRLDGYVDLFRETLSAGRMCLCGVLAAGFATLSPALQAALAAALDEQEEWLAGVLRDGQARGVYRAEASPEDQARSLIGALEGALLLARVHGDPPRFEAAVRWHLEGLTMPGQ